MKVLRIVLTAIFSILIATGLISIFMGKAPSLSILILLGYIALGLALNGKGGKIIRYLSIFISGILSLFLLVAVYTVVSPLLGERFDLVLFVISMLIGFLGASTVYCIVKFK